MITREDAEINAAWQFDSTFDFDFFMHSLHVKKERVGPIRGRHPWVFSGALKAIPEGLVSGDPVVLVDDAGTFLAQGYFNSYSQIAVRLWSWDVNEVINQDFFTRRVKQAFELRTHFVLHTETNACRVVYAENDLLPGLVVDKYADYLVVQFHTKGIERYKKEIQEALVSVIKPKGILERVDVKKDAREQNDVLSVGAHGRALLQWGDVPDAVKIKENGYTFIVDIKTGQKTGFFLDQRDKRQALTKYVKDKKVLNCFSYTGGFSVYALGAGASHVVSVDASEPALELAEQNVKVNKLDAEKCEFILADVKEYLADLVASAPHATANSTQPPLRKGRGASGTLLPEQGRMMAGVFDVIILDPPAFVKDRHKIKEGLQGYRKINEQALRILPPGGILLTCSCSAHVSLTDFRYMLTEAAARAGRTVQIIETFTHGIDHPELSAYTEGEYLKCLFVRVW